MVPGPRRRLRAIRPLRLSEPNPRPRIVYRETGMAPMRRVTVTVAMLAGMAPLALGSMAFAQSWASGRSVEAMRQRSEEIAAIYMQRWSSGNARALADVRALYGPRVSFHGDFIDQRNLFDQKRRFGQRWPIRHYVHRPGTMRTTCDAARQACLVRSIIDWEAAS